MAFKFSFSSAWIQANAALALKGLKLTFGTINEHTFRMQIFKKKHYRHTYKEVHMPSMEAVHFTI
jgi:hypothetical protein